MKKLVLLFAVFASAPLAAQDAGEDFISLLRSMEPLFQQVKQYSKEGKTVKAERLAKEGRDKILAHAREHNGLVIPASCPVLVSTDSSSIDGGFLECFHPIMILVKWDWQHLERDQSIKERIEDQPIRACRHVSPLKCRPVVGTFQPENEYSVRITSGGVVLHVVPIRFD